MIHHFAKQGYSIEWVVMDEFVLAFQYAYPSINFFPVSSVPKSYMENRNIGMVNGKLNIPIRFADSIMKVPYTECMKAKYMMYNLDWRNWKDNAIYQRNEAKENVLYHYLNPDNEPYNLVNNIFGSQSQLRTNITVNNDFQNIDMKTIAGYSLFDWSLLIERATNIHTVSTSIIYLLELLQLQAKEIHIYPRYPETHLKNVDYILTSHNYILHG